MQFNIWTESPSDNLRVDAADISQNPLSFEKDPEANPLKWSFMLANWTLVHTSVTFFFTVQQWGHLIQDLSAKGGKQEQK